MRKGLNVLQSLVIMERAKRSTGAEALATAEKIQVTGAMVYDAVGECTPGEVNALVATLMSSTDPKVMTQALLNPRTASAPASGGADPKAQQPLNASSAGTSNLTTLLRAVHANLAAKMGFLEDKVLKGTGNADVDGMDALQRGAAACKLRLKLSQALASAEFRLSQGCENQVYEAAAFVNEILEFRAALESIRTPSGNLQKI